MKISVLGCGRWGSFLSWYTSSHQGFDTYLWGVEDSPSYTTLRDNRRNEYVHLAPEITLTPCLQTAMDHADIIIISISSQALRGFIKRVAANGVGSKPIILCMKGIEVGSGKRLSEVCIEEGIDKNNIAVWIGPGHIQAFTQGIPNCMTIDSYDPNLKIRLANLFNSDLIRFYYGTDIIGNELGAATKNIMGICAGVLDGLGYGALKGPLMSRGAYEVSKLMQAMGGDSRSAYGLTHLGDYETTLFSEYSHNRQFGEQFAKNLTFGKLAEGVETTRAVHQLAQKYNVEMPITDAVYKILFENADIKTELNNLFTRSQKNEN